MTAIPMFDVRLRQVGTATVDLDDGADWVLLHVPTAEEDAD